MNPSGNKTIRGMSLLTLFMLFIALTPTVSADDDHKGHQWRERRHNSDNHLNDDTLRPVSNSTYAQNCGACHFVYQAELLPAGSWRKVLEGTDDHFGETVDLDPEARIEITGYLTSNAADRSPAELSRKIMKCLDGLTPQRITDISCFKKKHHEISSRKLKQSSVGSLSNCVACHRTAQNGVYDDDSVSIPE